MTPELFDNSDSSFGDSFPSADDPEHTPIDKRFRPLRHDGCVDLLDDSRVDRCLRYRTYLVSELPESFSGCLFEMPLNKREGTMAITDLPCAALWPQDLLRALQSICDSDGLGEGTGLLATP